MGKVNEMKKSYNSKIPKWKDASKKEIKENSIKAYKDKFGFDKEKKKKSLKQSKILKAGMMWFKIENKGGVKSKYFKKVKI